MDEITKRLIKLKPHLKDNTITQYLFNLKTLYRKLYNNEEEPQTLNFLKNKANIDELLETLNCDNTKKNYANICSIFLSVLKEYNYDDPTLPPLITHYNKYRDDLSQKYSKEAKNNKKSKTQEDNWIEYETLQYIKDGLKSHNFQAYVLLSLMYRFPMRNDMANLKIMLNREYNKLSLEEQKKINVLIRSNKGYEFILNNYKTDKIYAEKRILIDKEFNSMIRKQIKGRTYMFEFKKDTPFNTNQFSKYLNKIFKHTGKRVSSCMIRHVVLSHRYGKILTNMKEDAHNMGHSISTQKDYIKH